MAKSKKLDEAVIDSRITKKGKRAKSIAFLRESQNGEKFLHLASSFETSKKGATRKKWAFYGNVFFLPIRAISKLIEKIFGWSRKYGLGIERTEEVKLQKESIDKLTKELENKKIALTNSEDRIKALTLEIKKREDEFKKERETEFRSNIKRFKKESNEFEGKIENFKKDRSTEQKLQEFLEGHPWFLDLYCKDFVPQKSTGMGRFDFYLKRFDDSAEVMELKRPDANFRNSDKTINADFAQALDQLLKYFDDIIDISSSVRISRHFGISEFYPKGIIVYGYKPDSETIDFINRWKNSLRIEISTYDQILTKFRTAIKNLEMKK
jgi:hypothetical protein